MTEIVFGKEDEIGAILKKDGVSKVLFLYGTSSIKSTGLYDRITKILNESDITFIEYSGIESNPLQSDVDNAKKLGQENSVEAILAVGGGSVMDSAKAISTKETPIYNIVTLAATGSETNNFFTITNDETKEKLTKSSKYCYPKLSILNPELTLTVPPNYTAFSAVTIFSNLDNDENLISRLKEITERILINPEDYNARSEFMKLANKSVKTESPVQAIANAICGIHNIPYGAALSMVIPAYLKCQNNNKRSEEVEDWFHSLGAPIRLSEYNIDESTFDQIIKVADKAYSKDEIKNILEVANNE